MTLHQLRYVCEIARCKLNISRAAQAVNTSQPAISQQVRLLEEELGVRIFVRTRNRLTALTPEGEAIVENARHVLDEVANVHVAAKKRPYDRATKIRVAATHAQARYALPKVIRRFALDYPDVDLHLAYRHDELGRLGELVQNGDVDLAITTQLHDLPRSLVALECFPMKRVLIATRGHPLLRRRTLSLEDIAAYPLVTYPERSNGRRRLMRAFGAVGHTPRTVVSAIDEDVIKACVEEGLGVSIVASIAYDRLKDRRLGARDVSPLLEPSVTGVIVRRSVARRPELLAFIGTFAPQWTRERILHELQD
jgi:LysR family cys regulon transcriptional activator